MSSIDIRIRSLSYSSLLTLHSCPRKYQLKRMEAQATEDDSSSSVTFAFGHVVGLGIQEYLTHHSADKTIWACFLMWEPDLLVDNPKQAKSFWLAIAAVQQFISLCENNFMEDWKLAEYNGKPATELSFLIHFPNGFTYKGYVDAVLVNSITNEVMVLEVKTTSAAAVNGATYKNSAQAIGYSIVLDALFPNLSSYTVQYLIYKTKAKEYDVMQFAKTYLDRALWIRQILLDIDVINLYEDAGIYPMRGESCNEFYRECEYFGICTLATESIVSELTEEDVAKIQNRLDNEFQISLTLNDLIQSQLSKE